VRRTLGLLLAVLALAGATGRATTAFTRQDTTVTMSDGTPIAATLWLPAGSPPAGGWPALVLFHGLGGSREDMNTLAQRAFLPGDSYAVLTYDARGHGGSGGLVGVDGPNEVSDAKAMFGWLRDRPDVSNTKIGAFGISYGGGAVWNSLVAGVPWTAIEVCETWTDLATALVPQGLAKSGVIGGFLTELPLSRFDPSVPALRDQAFAGDIAPVRAYASERSSVQRLRGVKTPVFFMQGRRDFAFGLDQALNAWPLLEGPKHLWIGLHGHPPSAFPAPDTTAMLTEGRLWFDHYLLGAANGIGRKPAVEIAPVAWRGKTRGYGSPNTIANATSGTFMLGSGSKPTIGPSGRFVTPALPLAGPRGGAVAVFGAPAVTVKATASAGWSRLVAVLTAKTKSGQTIVISGGGVPTRPGTHTYTIRLISQMTLVPRGAKVSLTFGSSSLAQDPADLLYLQLPIPEGARLTLFPQSIRMAASIVSGGY
jgi:pimeloyl-ACP methyl ester carboxylesterase